MSFITVTHYTDHPYAFFGHLATDDFTINRDGGETKVSLRVAYRIAGNFGEY